MIAEGSRGYSSFAFYHLRDEGGLILGDPEEHPVKVFTGTDEYNAEIQPAAERIDALRNTKWAKIEVCDHSEFESEEVHGDTIKVGCYCGLSGTMTVPEVSYDTSEKDAMEGESPVYYYDGEEHCPGIRVTAGALELEKGKDYAVSCYDLTREIVTDSPVGPGEYKLILSSSTQTADTKPQASEAGILPI